jgi:hypothetical protein
MKPSVFRAAVLLLFFSASAFAQVIVGPPLGADTEYQVRYATNLNISDSIVDVTNTGANSTPTKYGTICVNVFGLSKGRLIACCSCPVAHDQLVALSVQKDLLANNNSPPASLVIKLISTLASEQAQTGITSVTGCDASIVGSPGHPIVSGMAAWSTVSQPLSQFSQTSDATETPFTTAHLSHAERDSLMAQCTPALGAGSICNSCPSPIGLD